uniref:Uncharacterized protein n=1 Tax=Phaseolus vulgaris TaxID=3885 RepID=V7C669_PHAVU|nr:hypothetical protein PHAVU_004G167100g [Phaseolus vulgaris]ESW24863.1 hypothetical protein PHAVU_004G167100g [Phaseolus vulgaris]
MGNSIRTVGLLNDVGVGEDEPFHHQLGRDGFIHLSEREFKITRGGSWSEKWTMSYTLGPSTSILSLTRSGKDKGATGLFIQLLSVIPEQNGKFSRYGYELDVETVPRSDALADLYLFGTEDIRGLTVLKKRKNMNEKEPHAVTLAHYFAYSSFAYSSCINHISRNRTEVSLSVIVKIGATNGHLDITVEGPEQHPAPTLRYLIVEAMRTKIWKRTLCPHCANLYRHRHTMRTKIWKRTLCPHCANLYRHRHSVPVAQRHDNSYVMFQELFFMSNK